MRKGKNLDFTNRNGEADATGQGAGVSSMKQCREML
jgi:hypothetical protein